MMHGFGFDGPMGGAGTFGWLWMIIPLLFWGTFLALIAWIVVRIFPNQRGNYPAQGPRGDSAEDILRQRFARGEINSDEYERTLSVLRGDPAHRAKESNPS